MEGRADIITAGILIVREIMAIADSSK